MGGRYEIISWNGALTIVWPSSGRSSRWNASGGGSDWTTPSQSNSWSLHLIAAISVTDAVCRWLPPQSLCGLDAAIGFGFLCWQQQHADFLGVVWAGAELLVARDVVEPPSQTWR